MLDPDPAARAAAGHLPGSPPGGSRLAGPHALQILTTEHWSLLAARQLGYTESMSRASIYVAALTGSVVALALVGQATDFGDAFVAFALVLLPVVFFLGVVTIARLGQINFEDSVWVQGMNRIRHGYLDLAPELEQYFVTSKHDDDPGVLASLSMPDVVPRRQAFIAVPGVVAVLDAVVAGAIAGIAGLGLDLGTAASIAIALAALTLTLVGFGVWAVRTILRYRSTMVVRFPTPPDGESGR
jgi:hypothetical protein